MRWRTDLKADGAIMEYVLANLIKFWSLSARARDLDGHWFPPDLERRLPYDVYLTQPGGTGAAPRLS